MSRFALPRQLVGLLVRVIPSGIVCLLIRQSLGVDSLGRRYAVAVCNITVTCPNEIDRFSFDFFGWKVEPFARHQMVAAVSAAEVPYGIKVGKMNNKRQRNVRMESELDLEQ